MNKRSAFTLIELIVVLGIIALLFTLVSAIVNNVRETAKSVACKNNLRQMILAALAHTDDHKGEFPPAFVNKGMGEVSSWEEFLWAYDARRANDGKVHQCPSFHGSAMWAGDHYTGYNYNSSYIGAGKYVFNGVDMDSDRSARLSRITNPANCAVFGDGEYESGANKFMRSPRPGPLDADAGATIAGTQGFRHRGATNVAFADGAVRSLYERHTNTVARGVVSKSCGFLSPDNSLYDYD